MTFTSDRVSARVFAATLESVSDAEAWVRHESNRLGLSGRAEFAINLCVEELFVNAVLHGGAREASLRIEIQDGPAKVEFADDGKPFDPTTAPALRIEGPSEEFQIGGYGTGLVRAFAREVSYRRDGERNCVTLEFDPEPSGAGGEVSLR